MASRSTFRDATHGVAWQKQLRDRFASDGAPDTDLSLKRARVRPVSRKVAEQIIHKYEWLGTMGPGTSHQYGLFFGMYCAGVCCLSLGSGSGGSQTHDMLGVDRHACATLVRGACVHWAPAGSNSKLVAWACRLFGAETGCKVVIAYADTDAGEIGTIYQACGWTHIGRGKAPKQYIDPDTGRIYSLRLLYNQCRKHNLRKSNGQYRQGDLRKLLLDKGWHEQDANPKHRYVVVLDKADTALIDRVAGMAHPYPKRAGSIDSDAIADPGGKGRGRSDPGAPKRKRSATKACNR